MNQPVSRSIGLLASAALLGLLALPAHAAEDAARGIAAANRSFELAVQRGDSNAIAALYTADGQVLPAQHEVISGTQAIAAFWQSVFDSGIKGATLLTVELESHGNTAHEVGSYQLRDSGGKLADHGKYIVIWKKQGGDWKLHRDIWTTSAKPSAPAPSAAGAGPR
ncbi:MAG TPA: DUF4440 domain-containing protein [Myxococcota bacterium]|nr:DUF4440 domain-containing protein [Myxococcota bacterium]